ncbi:uncharacterized protein C2845_PM15G10200 [Panicum miliaceum]|uniref:Uncharacterized protein n=1 Tax=Panicum miliaceum TaxID=4540 RepID=A0A3L6Q827_PANMI|nr:uncharacterized protein C2845_PM15G10200 [Panicum miliaceum]
MAPDARSLPAVSSVPVLAAGGGAARAWNGNGGGGAPSETAAAAVDVPALWSDECRMKRELVAWAKAVASMAFRESMQAKLTRN